MLSAQFPMGGNQIVYLQTKPPEEQAVFGDYYAIAFLSHNAERDRTYFKDKGFLVTEMAQLTLGANMSNIFFLIGPCGEVVEIYDIRK